VLLHKLGDRNEDGNTVLISPYVGKSPVGLHEEEDVFLWKEISGVDLLNPVLEERLSLCRAQILSVRNIAA
jgi:hypothetical protein